MTNEPRKIVVTAEVFAALNDANLVMYAIERGDGMYKITLVEGCKVYAYNDPAGFEF